METFPDDYYETEEYVGPRFEDALAGFDDQLPFDEVEPVTEPPVNPKEQEKKAATAPPSASTSGTKRKTEKDAETPATAKRRYAPVY